MFLIVTLQGQHNPSVDDAARHRSTADNDEDAEVLIECRNVYKSFGEKHILRGASFKVSLQFPPFV